MLNYKNWKYLHGQYSPKEIQHEINIDKAADTLQARLYLKADPCGFRSREPETTTPICFSSSVTKQFWQLTN